MFSRSDALEGIRQMRSRAPLVHCMTNEVVQEITANVLLAAGASPAMVVGDGEAAGFAAISSALLINVGTPYEPRLTAMRTAIESANAAGTPWVLDPVAAGVMPWRDAIIRGFSQMHPAVIRGNGSEILAMAGAGKGGKGVDSTDSSDSALSAAKELALRLKTIVCITGATDYATDGRQTLSFAGGSPMATLVVGTGCSLSALVAAFAGRGCTDRLRAAISACALAKMAAEKAAGASSGPGSFAVAYLDALYTIGR